MWVLVLLASAIGLSSVIAARRLARGRRADDVPQDMRRAGDHPYGSAADSAINKNSWMGYGPGS